MQKAHDHIDKFLPFGELIRGFANQSCISKGDLKRALRERGIFLGQNEREKLVPCISSILLSPSEFDSLRESQNTREDNPKKSSSRIEWASDNKFVSVIPGNIDCKELIKDEFVNYKLIQSPEIVFDDKNSDKFRIDFEIEREDYNKSWYESKNTFKGSVIVEKTSSNELQFIKTYTSAETEEVCNNLQNYLVKHFKSNGNINGEKRLNKILFGEFSNEHRIIFFWRLTSKMESIYYTFKDILDMEFRPDESLDLPNDIKWMYKKKELILKGNDIHNTFFIKEKEYYKYLQFWSLESKFDFSYLNFSGTCNVIFGFRDFNQKGNNAEFEINISNFMIKDSQILPSKSKIEIKQKLLEILERQKNDIYKRFKEYISKEVPV